MRGMDRQSAKKLVATAEHSLLKFLRSKAQVNCFKKEEDAKPYYATSAIPTAPNSPSLFNEAKLYSKL